MNSHKCSCLARAKTLVRRAKAAYEAGDAIEAVEAYVRGAYLQVLRADKIYRPPKISS